MDSGWEIRNKWDEPSDCSSLLPEEFPDCGTEKGNQVESSGSPKFKRQYWESREDKTIRVCRADAGGEVHRVRALEFYKRWPLSLQLSIEDATQGQGKNHQRIRSNNTQNSCRAWDSSCSYHSFENKLSTTTIPILQIKKLRDGNFKYCLQVIGDTEGLGPK